MGTPELPGIKRRVFYIAKSQVAKWPTFQRDAAAAYLNNSDNVFIVEDMKGNFRVLGSDRWITKTTVTQDGRFCLSSFSSHCPNSPYQAH